VTSSRERRGRFATKGCFATKVLVIGADGADPAILQQLMETGQLPNLARLRARGVYAPLMTTFPPVSPVAWTSFLTGVDPARHGVRDFVTKAPGTYRPTLGMFTVVAGDHGLPVYHSRRHVPTLGQVLTTAGRRSFTLRVPGDFPPHPVNGGVLAGLGMPDIVGSFGTSALYTTAQGKDKGRVKSLRPAADGWLHGSLDGPAHTSSLLTCRIQGNQLCIATPPDDPVPIAILSPGQWSDWLSTIFTLSDGTRIEGIAGIYRLKLVRLSGKQVDLYRTPIQCAPHAPLYPLTAPPDLAPYLADALGPFATLGLPADQSGLQQNLISPETFLEGADLAWDEQAAIVRHLIVNKEWDLFIAHYFSIDNAQHMFWRAMDPAHPAHDPAEAACFGDEIARAYRWVDRQVGELLSLVDDDVTVIVASDHGGTPIYRWFYLNSWLRKEGYLHVTPARKGQVYVDWARTRACGFGTGSIFMNVRDRDPQGLVAPGDEYKALRDELSTRLLGLSDPETGKSVVKAVLRAQDIACPDARSGNMPDLLLALASGYGLGRGEALGRISSKPILETNHTWWSGGHEGPYLPEDIPGVLLMAGPSITPDSQLDTPCIIDIAPTILHLLGVDVPPHIEGRILL
jgi:predicted AlkP superfamily phosphohydrolase/phosphomutase